MTSINVSDEDSSSLLIASTEADSIPLISLSRETKVPNADCIERLHDSDIAVPNSLNGSTQTSSFLLLVYAVVIPFALVSQVLQIVFFKMMVDHSPVNPYFFMVVTSFVFLVVYGVLWACVSLIRCIVRARRRRRREEEARNGEGEFVRETQDDRVFRVSFLYCSIIGILISIDDIVGCFAALKTPGPLQATIEQMRVPALMVFSCIILRRRYGFALVIAAGVVIAGGVFGMIPSLMAIIEDWKMTENIYPLLFLAAVMPRLFGNVLQEKATRGRKNFDLFHFLFVMMVWVLGFQIWNVTWNFVPGTGVQLNSWIDFGDQLRNLLSCMFVLDCQGKRPVFGLYWVLFVIGHVGTLITFTLIIRSIGSVATGMVSALAAPLAGIILLIVIPQDRNWFYFGALFIVLVGCVSYSIFEFCSIKKEEEDQSDHLKGCCCDCCCLSVNPW